MNETKSTELIINSKELNIELNSERFLDIIAKFQKNLLLTIDEI